MITHIEGRLVEKTPAYAIIDCSGVGYYINISLNTFSKLGGSENCKLFTHMVIREDAHTLYGFADQQERELFRKLISVSGVGAGTARMILSSLSPAEVQRAIVENDVNLLKSVKGVGNKSAERIIVDLRDKLGKEDLMAENQPGQGNTKREEALSALVALGFDKRSAGKALEKALSDGGADLSIEQLVKGALRFL